jgi:hypothetical protein
MICACATIQVQAEPLISQGALLNQDMKYENGKLGRWERGSSEFETVELSKSETHDGQASIHLKDSSCGKSNETLRLVLCQGAGGGERQGPPLSPGEEAFWRWRVGIGFC